MRDWTNEIEQAKKEVIDCKKQLWLSEWRHKNPRAEYTPTPPDTVVKAWFIAKWETGFVVCDYEELKSMPKRKREKILALGGLK